MSDSIRTLLVGSHFVPPAKLVLSILGEGTRVSLEPELDNPYDPNAIRVFVSGDQLIPWRLTDIEDQLNASGSSAEELLANDAICLGRVAASGGKPIGKAIAGGCAGLVGTVEVLTAMAEGMGWRLKFVGELILIEGRLE